MPLRNAFRSSLWIGAAIGLGALALQLEIMHLCGWFDYGTVQLNGTAIVIYGLLWALMFLWVGISEEGVLRGYVQRVTTDGLSMLPGSWSFWTSAVLFSILFAAAHLANSARTNSASSWFSSTGWLCASVSGARETFGSLLVITRLGIGDKHSCLVHPTAAFSASTLS